MKEQKIEEASKTGNEDAAKAQGRGGEKAKGNKSSKKKLQKKLKRYFKGLAKYVAILAGVFAVYVIMNWLKFHGIIF